MSFPPIDIVCSEGAVRVTNEVETTLSSGRVEVCVDNAYRFVCSDRWDEIDATVVCAQLNLSTSSKCMFMCQVLLSVSV